MKLKLSNIENVFPCCQESIIHKTLKRVGIAHDLTRFFYCELSLADILFLEGGHTIFRGGKQLNIAHNKMAEKSQEA